MTNLASWRRRFRASTCRKSTHSVADTSRQKAPRGTHLLKTAQKFAGVHCGRQWDLGQVPLLLQTRPRHQLRLLQRHVGHGLVGVSARKNKTSSASSTEGPRQPAIAPSCASRRPVRQPAEGASDQRRCEMFTSSALALVLWISSNWKSSLPLESCCDGGFRPRKLEPRIVPRQ